MTGFWEELQRPAPDAVAVTGGELRVGSRVRLHPRPGGDILDLALEGRCAVVEGIEQDLDGGLALAVVLDDDPGRDLGLARQPGHRFFFSAPEVELLDELGATPLPVKSLPRILVAGIGNVFLGDDGFGVAVADRLWRRELPVGVEVIDYGIRGMDLAFAMHEGYAAVILIDAVPRGQPPGTLCVIEIDPEQEDGSVSFDAHALDPVRVIALARSLGGKLPPTLLVGCEPQTRMDADAEEVVAQLSGPVRAAVDPAVKLVESLLQDIIQSPEEVSRP